MASSQVPQIIQQYGGTIGSISSLTVIAYGFYLLCTKKPEKKTKELQRLFNLQIILYINVAFSDFLIAAAATMAFSNTDDAEYRILQASMTQLGNISSYIWVVESARMLLRQIKHIKPFQLRQSPFQLLCQ